MAEYEGKIIEFLDEETIRIAVVIKQAKGKLQVLDERGRQARISPGRVIIVHRESLKAAADIVGLAKELRSKIDWARRGIDIELLWGSVSQEQEEFGIEELAQLYFGDHSPLEASALFRALAEDTLYFKRRGICFSPKTQAQVQEHINRLEHQRQKQRFRERAIGWIREVLSSEDPVEVPPDLGELLNRTEDFLLRKQGGEIVNLLSKVQEDLSAKEVAFDLLIRAGRLDQSADPLLVIAGIEERFRPEVVQAAEAIQPFVDLGERVDLSAQFCFSIDDEETEEIDDALTVEVDQRTLQVGIHIADVSHLVRKGDVLDREAYKRGVTVYLPRRKVTMIPERISCDRASLRQGELRPVMSFLAELDEEGTILSSRIMRSVIRVSQRLAYDEADRLMSMHEDSIGWLLWKLSQLANKLTEKREEKGALTIRRPELKVREKDGEIHLKLIDPRSPSRVIVSEMMILANQVAANYAVEHNLPIIFRAQDPPAQAIDDEVLASIKEAYDPLTFDRLVKVIRRSKLSLFPQWHAGLGLEAYTQLTSPIRRFADLVIQRQLAAYLADEPLPYEREELLEILATAEAAEREVRSIEQRANQSSLLEYLDRARKNDVFGAVVIRKSSGGYEVEIGELFIRGVVWTVSRLNVGDRINVRIEEVSPKKGTLRLKIAS